MPYRFTSKVDGDTRGRTDWAMVRQVHGATVRVAERVEHLGEGDAIVTTVPGLPIAVRVADCAPIVLEADGIVGVVHAGWRGLVAGVIPATIEVMRDLGADDVRAVLGPCIHAECYEWQPADLDRVVAELGDRVRGTTSWGTPAFDGPAVVRAQLPGVEVVDVCTACSPDHWSYRARGEEERQAVVAWI